MVEETFTRESLQAKPFVLVLMPFDKSFDDIYRFGIKGAAEDAGAYAERLDEQIFTGSILDRFLTQVKHADVIVADTTGRNANVFYEIGYAHAKDKVVLLVTKNAYDIPFDLKHHQHVIYDNIQTLRKLLTSRIEWGIRESKRSPAKQLKLRVTLGGADLSEGVVKDDLPVVTFQPRSWLELPLAIDNDSAAACTGFSHVYLFTEPDSPVAPYYKVMEKVSRPLLGGWDPKAAGPQFEYHDALVERFITKYRASPADAPDGLTDQYKLPNAIAAIPAGAVEHEILGLGIREKKTMAEDYVGAFRLRLHGNDGVYDFSFRLKRL